MTVEGHDFAIRELSHADYMHILSGEDSEHALRTVSRGVVAFREMTEADVSGLLPSRMLAQLAQAVMKLSVPEDALGNFESAQDGDSSSV